jgi:predicted ATP-grasp superfamily ATP-dependent carboligase
MAKSGNNILIFPCGSEIGLEIRRAFESIRSVTLVGGSSVPDHGRFVFERYREGLPRVDDVNFVPELKRLIREEDIAFLFAAHDSAVLKCAQHEQDLGCQVIGSPFETCSITRSKRKTYQHLQDVVPTPATYSRTDPAFPVFLKPDVGEGSKGTVVAHNRRDLDFYTAKDPSLLILEYLPGEEYTVDCFTDRNRNLIFVGPRRRNRILNGISVATFNVQDREFTAMAERINERLVLNGAWFFQVKRSAHGVLTLMEVAPRIGGSSGLYRVMGVNLPVLSYYNRLGLPLEIHCNKFDAEMDRAWSNRYKLKIDYKHVYIDFDDCLCIDGKVNSNAVKFLVQAINHGKKICLLSRHREGPLAAKLKELRILDLFDEVREIGNGCSKAEFVREDSIFIDDSFTERQDVARKRGVPVFAVDAIDSLLTD